MNYKRKRDEAEPDTKKSKNYISTNERENQPGYNTSNEWPIYSHPDGGLVKITPWGSLRQYTDSASGELVSKFEDTSFHEHSFNMANNVSNAAPQDTGMCLDTPTHSQMPPTPQSIQQCQLTTPIRTYPSEEAETYVLNGYEGFNQEHENYFGMDDSDSM